MKTWVKRIIWIAATFFIGTVMLFVLLVLGVQHGDTYRGQDHPSFSAAAKYVIKKTARAIKNGIYHEATIHNPAGDTIPDSWDNTIKGAIKSIF